jgi:hypothetical protein
MNYYHYTGLFLYFMGFLWTMYSFFREEKRWYRQAHRTWWQFFCHVYNKPLYYRVEMLIIYISVIFTYIFIWPIHWVMRIFGIRSERNVE